MTLNNEDLLNNELKLATQWFGVNKLSDNLKKTKSMLFMLNI